MELLTKLIGYGLLGLLIECIFTGVKSWFRRDPYGSSATFLIMIPIYAQAGGLMEFIRVNLAWNPLALAPIYMLIIYGTEFSWGWFLEKVTGKNPWHYGRGKWTIMGHINLKYWVFWLSLALAFNWVSMMLHKFSNLLHF